MNHPPSHAPFSVPPLTPLDAHLYVVTAISTPARFHSRYRLYRAFEKHVRDAGALLLTVEMAFGDRPFEVTDAANPHHVQVRSRDELWHKENLLNLGLARLPASARYLAWIDADVAFARPDWAQETVQQLQHYQVVQMFSHAQDVGPQHEPIETQAYGWIESVNRGFPFAGSRKNPAGYGSTSRAPGRGWIKGAWHSGLAWAARREALDAVGGLLDFAILGSADRNMAGGLFGNMEATIDPAFSPAYRAHLLAWQHRAERHLRRNIGQVPGLLTHFWHGRKSQRGYLSRWKILADHQFDPHTDLKRDTQGLWQLHDDGTPRFIRLRDEIRAYFRSRNEDSIDP